MPSPAETSQRRLAAILAADVVGYSRLMSEDEEATLDTLASYQDVVASLTAEHQGRIFGMAGDGMMIEFASAVHAVRCAVAIQRALDRRNAGLPERRRVVFRVGINLGDVIAREGDLYGECVNIAARLQTLAEPGSIFISASVHDQIRAKLGFACEPIGERGLKNIPHPVQVYSVEWGLEAPSPVGQLQSGSLALPDKPSIAVLPFANMSGDVEQEYFADGMVEDITTALSRLRWLFVIARNSSFTYKGRAIDVKQVGRELGVRYILEGSVRKSGNKVRITGQLIDTSTGTHLWADRFDGDLQTIFDLQDQVTASVVAAIAPKLEMAEIERIKSKPTARLDAYDTFLRGMACHHQWTKQGNEEALNLFYKAIELDPAYSAAYGMASRCFVQRKAISFGSEEIGDIAEAERLARQARAVGKDDAIALWTGGFTLAYVVGDVETGDVWIERALALNPNLTLAWAASGWVKAWLGDPDTAIEREGHAIRLSPQDTLLFSMQAATALAHLFAGRFEAAMEWAEAASRELPNFMPAYCIIAAAAAMNDELQRARHAVQHLLHLNSMLRVSALDVHYKISRPEHRAIWSKGLRKAGLSE